MRQNKLNLPPEKIKNARNLATDIVRPVQSFIYEHTTISVERAVLRLMGADGVDSCGVPVPNIIADSLNEYLADGLSKYYINALVQKNITVKELDKAVVNGLDLTQIEFADKKKLENKALELIANFEKKVKGNIAFRNNKLEQYKGNEKSPLLYVIVATGNIYEDIKQAQAAAFQGADIVAVIRTTAQSLLDYVPYGATTEGFGGTYATQENFRIMRSALDESCTKVKRYIRLVNYCSGLCMPEIAVMGALERLDMMLNDSMYGVLFRDINMYRTFVDQNFSRMINAYSDIIINTGEDNYLTTSDAIEKAYTVLASQFINEKFAYNAGLPSRLMGLGHAFEIDPSQKNAFLLELAQAQMAREIFPDCPLKYMPPTKFMSGDIFRGYALNTMFNFASKATGQSIHLLGMISEAMHNPYIQDRHLAIENALYVMNNMDAFYNEIEFRQDGLIVKRAHKVLDEAISFLQEINTSGLFISIEKGDFAEIKRKQYGGKGFDGVVKKSKHYWNPFESFLKKNLNRT